MIFAGIALALLASCGDDGQGRKPNIFGDEESFVKVEYTSNADTVYLRWTLTDKDTRFDSYEVTDNRTGRVVTAGREATSCFLTHIPYAEPVSVYLSLMQDGKVLKTNKTDLVIDGLDRVTAGIIIPDRGSVTGGDGMYSVALPDGRSIFLMGDSYTGTVTGGRRSTSDHMYRNSYIVYDDGRVSAITDANGPGTSGAVPPGVTNEGQKWYWPGHGFVADNPPEDVPNPILDYIMGSDADIVCLQEAYLNDAIVSAAKEAYGYVDSVMHPTRADCLVLFSKYPILSKDRIEYKSKGNLSAAFKVNIGGDVVTVVNNHFETTGLSLSDRAGFKDMMKGKSGKDTIKAESKRLAKKLGEAARKRAPQVDAVAGFVRECREPVILCGDFNDSPISYARRTLGKVLTDCYVATGNGPGISYHHNAFFVRIDNIMCSADWRPYGCKVDRSNGYSDHYPIYCWLKRVENDKNGR